jgi:hypothetical protein
MLLVRRMVGCHGLAQMLRCSLAAPLLHFSPLGMGFGEN